jgi:ribosome-associated protein
MLRFDMLNSAVLTDAQKERLRHRIPPRFLTKKGEVVISAEGSRDQEANRTDCRQKLADAIREGLKRPKTRIATKPSRGSKERRLKAKAQLSRKKRERRQKDW